MATLVEICTWNRFELSELEKVAARLSECLPHVGVVAVHGPMGAGKTTLVRALLQAWGVEEDAASPTFGLVHHHTALRHGEEVKVRHMDLYRLEDEEEAERSGIAEMLGDPALNLVEWPERVPGLMPEDAWLLRIEPLADGARSCILSQLQA